MELTIKVNPTERTVRFREVHALAAGDSCAVVLDGVRGADVQTLRLALYRDAASDSPVASCPSFAPVQGHPNLATGTLRLDTVEMAAWFEAVRPESAQEGSPGQTRSRPEDAAERAVRTDGWLVVSDSARTWAACRVPVILRPGAGTSGVTDPTSLAALVGGLVSAALAGKADKVANATSGNLASLGSDGSLADSGMKPADFADATGFAAHKDNTGIHVTAEQKTAWTAKYDKPPGGIPKSDLAAAVQTSLGKADTAVQSHQSLDAYVNAAGYDSDAKEIQLKHDSVVVARIDATAFIKDGMVDSVEISGGNLVISFNTDAGVEDIEIPLTDIFNPANYYDKTAADGRYVQKEAGKGLFSGSYNDLTDKPTIPAAVTVDSALSGSSANPVQNKVVAGALAQRRGLGDLAVYRPTFSGWTFTPLVEGGYLDAGPDWIATEEDFNESAYSAAGLWDGAGWYVIYGIEGSGEGAYHPSGGEDATELLVSSDGRLARTVTGWAPVSPADFLAKLSQLPAAYGSSPAMDGAASPGSSAQWARGDHVHPSDTGKADKATTLAGYGITDAKIENGKITLGGQSITPLTSVPTATASQLGVVKPDGTTITVDANGVISAVGGGGGGGLWTGGNLTFSLRIYNSYPEDATGYLLLIHGDGSTQKVTWNGSNLGPVTYQDVSLAWLFPTGGLDGSGEAEGGLVTFTTGGSSVAGALMQFDGMQSSYSNVFPIPCAFVLDGDATLAVNVYTSCLIEGTAILLANGSSKPVEDIGYDDELAVWDFDEGCMSSAKPCWIKKPQRVGHAWRNRFSDGTEVWTTGTVAGHRFFSLDTGRFLYNTDCVGHRIYKFDGSTVTLESATLEHGNYEFYNLITAFHGNCFAGGILAGYRYCNLYPIAGMKYVKDGRRLRSPDDYPSVSKEMFDGCRLAEVQDNPEDVVRYIIDTKESVRLL